MPGAVIEAMALGLPIVASDIPALGEVVEPERNASLVPPTSATALAAAIEALLADRARAQRYGDRSRKIFEERFTLEKSVSRMIALYFRIAAENR
jgi:glycosyltransferase involved in cell wall biosynthesis